MIEWAGTVAFGAATVIFWMAMVRSPERIRKIVSGLLGLVFFLSFMEELSWGQQIFKWNTPTAFESNVQIETNLHNFSFVFDQQQACTAGILFLTIVLPLADLRGPTRKLIDRLGLPVVSLQVAAWVTVTLVIANVAERAMTWEAHRGLREYMETMWGVAAVLVALAALRRSDEDRALAESVEASSVNA